MQPRRPLPRRPHQRTAVDAGMAPEARVLISEQHRQIARIDLAGGRRQPPAAVGQGEGAQQPAVAVDDDRRAEPRGSEVERAKAFDIGVPRRGPAESEDENERAEDGEEAAFASVRWPFPPCGGRCRAKPDG